MKKALSLILAVIMCFSAVIVIPFTASAKNVEIAETSAAKLAAPKITKLTGTASGVKITIAKVNGAAKYAYFFLSNHKWKKIGVTAATSFVHKGVTSGKRYIYTVRCVAANGKTFTSAYNKKGWVITYKKPVNWSSLYKSFVMNKKYMPYVLKSQASNQGRFLIFLYDADFDGIPELFVNTGYISASNVHEIFTIKNGKVKYLYRQPMFYTYSGSAPKSKFKGFFTFGGHTGYSAYTYHYINKGKWQSVTVMSFRDVSVNSKIRYELSSKTTNKGLYDAFIAATNPASNGLRSFKHPGFLRDYSAIKSMGWNAFVKNSGY